MRSALTLLLVALVGCQTIHDMTTPDVPKPIADHQDNANIVAFDLLNDLDKWIEAPDTVPSDAAFSSRAKIQDVLANLNAVRIWMLDYGVEGGVTQTVVDLLTAWEDYIDDHFCAGEDAWLVTRVKMNADDTHAWHQVFAKMKKLHKQVRTWMEHKGVQDGES